MKNENRLSRKILPLLLVTLAASALPAQEAWQAGLKASVEDTAANYFKPVVTTAFGSLTYGHMGLGSGWSRFLEEALAKALTGSSKVKDFVRYAVASMDLVLRKA